MALKVLAESLTRSLLAQDAPDLKAYAGACKDEAQRNQSCAPDLEETRAEASCVRNLEEELVAERDKELAEAREVTLLRSELHVQWQQAGVAIHQTGTPRGSRLTALEGEMRSLRAKLWALQAARNASDSVLCDNTSEVPNLDVALQSVLDHLSVPDDAADQRVSQEKEDFRGALSTAVSRGSRGGAAFLRTHGVSLAMQLCHTYSLARAESIMKRKNLEHVESLLRGTRAELTAAQHASCAWKHASSDPLIVTEDFGADSVCEQSALSLKEEQALLHELDTELKAACREEVVARQNVRSERQACQSAEAEWASGTKALEAEVAKLQDSCAQLAEELQAAHERKTVSHNTRRSLLHAEIVKADAARAKHLVEADAARKNCIVLQQERNLACALCEQLEEQLIEKVSLAMHQKQMAAQQQERNSTLLTELQEQLDLQLQEQMDMHIRPALSKSQTEPLTTEEVVMPEAVAKEDIEVTNLADCLEKLTVPDDSPPLQPLNDEARPGLTMVAQPMAPPPTPQSCLSVTSFGSSCPSVDIGRPKGKLLAYARQYGERCRRVQPQQRSRATRTPPQSRTPAHTQSLTPRMSIGSLTPRRCAAPPLPKPRWR